MINGPGIPDDVAAFLATVPDQRRRTDAGALVGLMADATGEAPAMWGSSIVGFGSYHYRYHTGREGDTVAVGFSPRKSALTLYVCAYLDRYADLLAGLGTHTLGKGCLYIKRLADVDTHVLAQIVARSHRLAQDAASS